MAYVAYRELSDEEEEREAKRIDERLAILDAVRLSEKPPRISDIRKSTGIPAAVIREVLNEWTKRKDRYAMVRHDRGRWYFIEDNEREPNFASQLARAS